MPVTTEGGQETLDQTRRAAHPHCIACGAQIGSTPRLHFVTTSDEGVEAVFQPSPAYEGYEGLVHGGVIATLLDAAMTNCLFARGLRGLTADLHVRYRHSVLVSGSCLLRSWVERATPPLFVLKAELWQDGQMRVTGTGKFMSRRA